MFEFDSDDLQNHIEGEANGNQWINYQIFFVDFFLLISFCVH